jgi:polyhydroxyalkanoate synthesis regulator phasin
MQTKMDIVLQKLETSTGTIQTAQKELSDLEKRVIVLEQQAKPKTP